MDIFGYAWLVGLGLLVAIFYLQERRRSAEIRSLAKRSGFHFLGRGVPRSLRLRGTPLERATSIWNVVDGDRFGVRIVAFDCKNGTGKGAWRRTVIAVEAQQEVLDRLASYSDLTVDHSGSWAIFYRPKAWSLFTSGLMPVAELESRLNAIA
jgi:hypothetical protein